MYLISDNISDDGQNDANSKRSKDKKDSKAKTKFVRKKKSKKEDDKKKKKEDKRKTAVNRKGSSSSTSSEKSSPKDRSEGTDDSRKSDCKEKRDDVVLALYDYEAEGDDELSFEVGDIISLIRKESGGWWEGELDGKRGFFPVNYVREISVGEFETEEKSVNSDEYSDESSSEESDEETMESSRDGNEEEEKEEECRKGSVIIRPDKEREKENYQSGSCIQPNPNHNVSIPWNFNSQIVSLGDLQRKNMMHISNDKDKDKEKYKMELEDGRGRLSSREELLLSATDPSDTGTHSNSSIILSSLLERDRSHSVPPNHWSTRNLDADKHMEEVKERPHQLSFSGDQPPNLLYLHQRQTSAGQLRKVSDPLVRAQGNPSYPVSFSHG